MDAHCNFLSHFTVQTAVGGVETGEQISGNAHNNSRAVQPIKQLIDTEKLLP